MNTEIANIIKGKIENLPFVEVITGLVRSVSYSESSQERKIVKTLPVGCNVTADDCLKVSKLKELVPNSKVKSIIYFEDGGVSQSTDSQQTFKFESNLKLVCWLNLPKLGKTDCSVSGLAIGAILKAIPIKYFNEGSFTNIQIKMNSQDVKSNNIFSKYSYDETQAQYLLYPYDYFALNFNVKFTLNEKCIEDFTTNTQISCP